VTLETKVIKDQQVLKDKRELQVTREKEEKMEILVGFGELINDLSSLQHI